MSISCSALYLDILRELGKGDSTDLQSSFLRAVNRTLDELSQRSDAATPFTHVTATTDTISGLSDNYEWIVYTGVVFNLIRAGYRPSDPRIASAVFTESGRRWEDGAGTYCADLDNITQATDSNNMTRLGSVQ